MNNLLGRLGNLLRSEISALGADDDEVDLDEAGGDEPADKVRVTARAGASGFSRRVDAAAAYKMLELPDGALLDEVRAQYRVMVRRYHPKSVDGSDEQRVTAQSVLDGLTQALEVLETHLLPTPETPRSR